MVIAVLWFLISTAVGGKVFYSPSPVGPALSLPCPSAFLTPSFACALVGAVLQLPPMAPSLWELLAGATVLPSPSSLPREVPVASAVLNWVPTTSGRSELGREEDPASPISAQPGVGRHGFTWDPGGCFPWSSRTKQALPCPYTHQLSFLAGWSSP